MCGFAGFLELAPTRSLDATLRLINEMSNRLTHRGPDNHGHWVNESGTVALGHRRLSILDTSQHGHQPMTSPCGRFVLAYNGEVYNHLELRRELLNGGANFRGQSDTETIVTAFSRWGIAETVKRSIGMFAMAIWDCDEQSVTLIRDRLGIKPLYYGVSNGCLLFGSELKALRVHPAFRKPKIFHENQFGWRKTVVYLCKRNFRTRTCHSRLTICLCGRCFNFWE